MAKKNVRSHAADSSENENTPSPPGPDFSSETTPNKPARGRARSVEIEHETWPVSEELKPRRGPRQPRSGESETTASTPPDSEKNSPASGDRSGRGRGRVPRTVDRLDADGPNFLEESSEFIGSSGSNGAHRDPGDYYSNEPRRNDNRGSFQEGGSESRDVNRDFGDSRRQPPRGPQQDGGSENRDGNRDGGRRRSRRRRGGGGGGQGAGNVSGGGGGSSPQGRQNQDQRGGSRRSRRGRSNSNNNSNSRQNFSQDRNRNQDRNQTRNQPRHQEPVELDDAELYEGKGMLEVHPNGYGFLRHPDNNYAREKSDPFVPGTMIEKFSLRPGVMLRGMIQPARRQQGPRLRELQDVDGIAPEEYVNVKSFDELTAINPVYWYRLESGPTPLTTRVMDLLTPLGKGQRALIVAPPRSGKTILLQHIANGIAENHPKTKLIVLLIDERPEEVTDMKRNVRGEVIASSLDEDIESHVRLSQIVIARCKRLAEMGQDVFLLMDSITRLARAFNKWVGNTGRTMSGGVDIKAMDIPKKLFSSARAFEEGGSLTIVGTALVDTGSRMDELIFQEFKGTGNMELVLDRKLSDRRVWPAIDISQSGTRREELLLHPDTLHAVTMLRRTLTSMNHVEAMEQLIKQLGRFKTNQEFINLISGKMGEL